jgi:superfamily II DNA/RNA helicase
VVIIAPTRELALQIYGVAKEVMKYHSQTHGVIMGGANRKYVIREKKNVLDRRRIHVVTS